MSDEIKERPDKPGIWQRDGGINPISLVYANEADRLMVISTSGYCRPNDEALARWRLIIDADGKQVCDPDEPWPPKTRKEKRRVVQFRYSHDDPDDSARVYYYSVRAKITPCKTVQIICDEIRDCEIGENGTVIGVWSDSV